ncbi:MAG: hypothetical protein Q8L09_03730 [Candidatus Moranbacteria bacterium]|nr:hypothetical protein [Candidatus Moranbacteria bacterium]
MAYHSRKGGGFNKKSAIDHLGEFSKSLQPIQDDLFDECGIEGEEKAINQLAMLVSGARSAIDMAVGFIKHRMPKK